MSRLRFPSLITALWFALVVGGLLGSSSRALADTSADKKRATALLQEGAKLLDRKDFAAALERFTEAYGLVASAKIQFNIGLAQEALDHPAEAIRAYRIYIDEATTDLAARRTDARVRIDALRPHVTQVQVNADVPGATVLIDGVEQGHAPLPRPAVVNPGVHQVVVQSPTGGAPWTKAIRGEAGARLELQATLIPAVAPPPLTGPTLPTKAPDPVTTDTPPLIAQPPAGDTPAESPPVYKRAWFWGAVAAVVAAGVVGGVLATRGGGSTTTFACDFPPCPGAAKP